MAECTTYEVVNQVARTYFHVLDSSGALVPGLVAGDFTIRLYDPTETEVSGSITVTVAEIGSTGEYYAEYTPNALGQWTLEIVSAAYFVQGKRNVAFVDAVLHGAYGDTLKTVDFLVLDSSGGRVTGLVTGNFTITLYDPTDAEVSGSVPVTVSELGFGQYRASFTITTTNQGKWLLVIKNATYFAFGKRSVERYATTSGSISTPVIDSWANDGTGTSITMQVSNVDPTHVVQSVYIPIGSTAAVLGPTRTGPGAIKLTGLTENQPYLAYVYAYDPSSPACFSAPSNVIFFAPFDTAADAVPVGLEGLGVVDWELDSDGDILLEERDFHLIDGTALIRQKLQVQLRTFLGEWFLDTSAGVPYYQSILGQKDRPDEDVKGTADSIIKANILIVEGVNRILAYESELESDRTFSATFTADTIYGPVTVEGISP